MSSSSCRFRRATVAAALLVSAMWSTPAVAQTPAQGFDLERFYPSAAGAGWFVMDDLDIQPGLGGALELTTGYGRNPLVLSDGSQRLSVVSNEAFADISAAVTYDRFRLYVDFPMPIALSGDTGTLGGYAFTAPSINFGTNPDSITDVRVGADARLYGRLGDVLRLGLGAQLFVPSNAPDDTPGSYLTDGTVRAMFRALVAGDLRKYQYAGQLGVHLRPLSVSPQPDGPDGSELLFGIAAGRRFEVGPDWTATFGPEIFGETAFLAFFGRTTTGVEGLLSGRLEGTGDGAQTRVKLGLGAGLDPQFGVPQWRVVLAVELFSNHRVTPASSTPQLQ